MRIWSALFLAWPALAGAAPLDCTAERVCVAGFEVTCEEIEVVYSLDPGKEAGDKLVMTTEEGERSYEFRRLADFEGVRVQGAGGALEAGQGAGAMTVFDDLSFLLTRHALVPAATDPDERMPVSISIHGRCEEAE